MVSLVRSCRDAALLLVTACLLVLSGCCDEAGPFVPTFLVPAPFFPIDQVGVPGQVAYHSPTVQVRHQRHGPIADVLGRFTTSGGTIEGSGGPHRPGRPRLGWQVGAAKP